MIRHAGRIQLLKSQANKKVELVRCFSVAAKPVRSNSKEDESLWVKSPLPDIPTVTGYTIPEIIRENIGPWGSYPAFESYETGKVYTHDEVLKYSRGFAAAMIRSGYKRGDIIGVVLPNVPEYAIVLLGLWEAGYA